MKELSIEEKAKRYDELFVKAKQIYNKENDVLIIHTIEELFSELNEGEDEKIRKAITTIVDYWEPTNYFFNNVSKEKCIVWLEKQGEQNYKIIKGKNYFCVKTHNYAGVEWIKGTKYYASDNYTLVNQGCECYCPEYSKEEHNNLFEEVKSMIVANVVTDSTDNPMYENENEDAIAWLEKQGEKKPAWNEEDERMIDTIIYDLERHGGKEDSCYSAEINWLKSLRDRYTWKPSDEQIGVIEAVINNRSFQRRHLDSLYADLKRLRKE